MGKTTGQNRKALLAILNTFFVLVVLLGVLRFPPESLGSSGPRFPTRPIDFNIRWWSGVGEAMEEHGLAHVWTPYPPLFPTLFRGYWFLTGGDLGQITILWWTTNALALVGLAWCVLRLRGLVASIATVLLFSVLTSFVGIGIQADQFDLLPTALLVLGVTALWRNHPVAGGLAAGLGAATKVFPGLLLVVAVGRLARPDLLRFSIAFALTLGVIFLPFLALDAEMFLSGWRWNLGRTSWETVYHAPEVRLPPMPDAIELTRPVLTIPDRADEKTPPLWLLATAMVALAGWLRWRGREPADLARGALSAVLLLLLLSPGVSSYYAAWILGLLALVYQGRSAFLIGAGLLAVANLEWVVWEGASSPLPLYWPAIFLRQAIFLALLVDTLRKIGRPTPEGPERLD